MHTEHALPNCSKRTYTLPHMHKNTNECGPQVEAQPVLPCLNVVRPLVLSGRTHTHVPFHVQHEQRNHSVWALCQRALGTGLIIEKTSLAFRVGSLSPGRRTTRLRQVRSRRKCRPHSLKFHFEIACDSCLLAGEREQSERASVKRRGSDYVHRTHTHGQWLLFNHSFVSSSSTNVYRRMPSQLHRVGLEARALSGRCLCSSACAVTLFIDSTQSN